MSKFCHSCAAPLSVPGFRGAAENYCRYCSDEAGALKPRKEVRSGIAIWMMSWQPGLDERAAKRRAKRYMRAMPAWANDQDE